MITLPSTLNLLYLKVNQSKAVQATAHPVVLACASMHVQVIVGIVVQVAAVVAHITVVVVVEIVKAPVRAHALGIVRALVRALAMIHVLAIAPAPVTIPALGIVQAPARAYAWTTAPDTATPAAQAAALADARAPAARRPRTGTAQAAIVHVHTPAATVLEGVIRARAAAQDARTILRAAILQSVNERRRLL